MRFTELLMHAMLAIGFVAAFALGVVWLAFGAWCMHRAHLIARANKLQRIASTEVASFER